MPLGERGGDTSSTKYCGIEIRFNSIMKDAFGFNVGGGFDFVVAPLVSLVSNLFFTVVDDCAFICRCC